MSADTFYYLDLSEIPITDYDSISPKDREFIEYVDRESGFYEIGCTEPRNVMEKLSRMGNNDVLAVKHTTSRFMITDNPPNHRILFNSNRIQKLEFNGDGSIAIIHNNKIYRKDVSSGKEINLPLILYNREVGSHYNGDPVYAVSPLYMYYISCKGSIKATVINYHADVINGSHNLCDPSNLNCFLIIIFLT